MTKISPYHEAHEMAIRNSQKINITAIQYYY